MGGKSLSFQKVAGRGWHLVICPFTTEVHLDPCAAKRFEPREPRQEAALFPFGRDGLSCQNKETGKEGDPCMQQQRSSVWRLDPELALAVGHCCAWR